MLCAAKIKSISSILFLAGILTACGGGDKSASNSHNDVGVILGSSNGDADNSAGDNGNNAVLGIVNTTPITISGSVGDGPIIGATITILDASGQEIARTTSNLSASYSVTIPSGSAFPLVITASGGTDIVTNQAPTFTMVSAVTVPENNTANLNPFSTLIVKTAGRMPSGLTAANIGTASRNILAVFNSGLDITLLPDPITTPVTAQNAATVIKSSEVLAEIIRRNHSALLVVYPELSQDNLISALAADISDGNFDGTGTTGADPVISAVNTIVSALVLTEALSNTLQVNNTVVTSVLDEAVKVVAPSATQKTGDLPVNDELLLSIRTALAAAMAIAPSEVLAELESAVESIDAGSTAEDIAKTLPSDTNASLDEVVTEVSTSPAEDLDTVNDLTGAVYEEPVVVDTTSNIAPLATVSASSENILKEQTAIKVIDGVVSGYPVNRKKEWATVSEKAGAWIQLNWSTSYTISRMVLHDRLNTGDQILSGTLQFSDGSRVSVGELPNDSTGLEITFPARTVNSVRFTIDTVSTTTANVGLAEWEVFPVSAAENGNSSEANASNTLLTLTWQPNPESVDGYIVYFGPSEDAVTAETTDIKAFAGSFDPQNPSIQYDSWYDLGLQLGDNVCFKLRAYNADGFSDWSLPACTIVATAI